MSSASAPSPRGAGAVERAPAEFMVPKWAAKPAGPAVLEELGGAGRIDLRAAPSFVVGRVSTADIILEHASVSRHHAGLCHHTNGRLYVIDLNSAFGTVVDGKKLDKHKPTHLSHGSNIRFGDGAVYTFRDTKRSAPAAKAGQEKQSGKRARLSEGGEPLTVQCRHLLVKHKDSRNPKSSNPKKDREATITRQVRAGALVSLPSAGLSSRLGASIELRRAARRPSSAQRAAAIAGQRPTPRLPSNPS